MPLVRVKLRENINHLAIATRTLSLHIGFALIILMTPPIGSVVVSPPPQEFRHIAAFPSLPETNRDAVWLNEHIWLFGKKCGHCASFNTSAGEWDSNGSTELLPISGEENLSELLFTFQQSLYLLLFVPFGAFKVTELYEFSPNSRQFEHYSTITTKLSDELSANPAENFKQELVRVKGDTPEGVYFISYVDHKIHLHLLRIPSAEWKLIAEVGSEADPLHIQPTLAAWQAPDTIYVQGGVHGCGFMWQPSGMIKFSGLTADNATEGKAATPTSQWVEIAGDESGHRPSWSFHGSLDQVLLPTPSSASYRWVHFAGINKSGMTGSVFNGDVWSIVGVDSNTPRWSKSKSVEIPHHGTQDGSMVIYRHTGALDEIYALSKESGIMRLSSPVI